MIDIFTELRRRIQWNRIHFGSTPAILLLVSDEWEAFTAQINKECMIPTSPVYIQIKKLPQNFEGVTIAPWWGESEKENT